GPSVSRLDVISRPEEGDQRPRGVRRNHFVSLGWRFPVSAVLQSSAGPSIDIRLLLPTRRQPSSFEPTAGASESRPESAASPAPSFRREPADSRRGIPLRPLRAAPWVICRSVWSFPSFPCPLHFPSSENTRKPAAFILEHQA